MNLLSNVFLQNIQRNLQSKYRKNILTLWASTTLSSLVLTGCSVGPNYVRPTTTLPSAYTEQPTASSTDYLKSTSNKDHPKNDSAQQFIEGDIPAQWWEVFHSKALNELVTASLQHNPNIDAAQATLRGALESVQAQQGAFFPTANVSFNSTRQKTAAVLASPLTSNAYFYTLHTAQVNVSYSLDLFGSNRRQVESLQAQAAANSLQLEGSLLTLSSNVVNAAIQEALLRSQISVTQDIIASQKTLYDIAKHQLAFGQLSIADVATQEATLAAVEATLPPLQKQLAIQRDLIKALAGRYPNDTLDAPFSLDDLVLPQALPFTLPSSLVEHRPDIRAAEEQLHAASANIGVAIANRLPNITLGVNSYGSSATHLSDLLKSATNFWSLTGGITQPIFDGGMLKHRQGVAQAAYDLAAAQYRSTVINAFQNVADVLQAIQVDHIALLTAEKSERLAEKSTSIARQQLALGDISAAALLVIEQNNQQAKLNRLTAQANRLQDTVALFQALGGGWWNRTDVSANVTSNEKRK